MNEWVAFISNVGFPVTITLYLLVRIEAKLEQLASSITQLTQTLYSIKE
ncbi:MULTISPECIES: YvrJ family protein [Aneurinibacillus]|uniref:YvrJ family protein n=1 Tax=Aneurinibacillus thermoaerophilus TaxID=143495 RepID=A0ABX8YFN8_ANETH|nr:MULTISPECIES: YvrJ family protein [Aneurinibacillus]MED0677392.1 YvrJ family protein [Aneurinibacillus thermoaerophilus]MED0679482.1 YvrJ family protein [Aneurinibacillus thermoaerophilus]MED0737947.1 YvrJ family protein [Aneurinibacillus thermoaerophilus]MED0756369.1 YvrJ family protein [Aneurinibacillus thermoaerophilus]MED0760196.1 YvrJ family protein [Aneurinibacillus thermoaerophilus]